MCFSRKQYVPLSEARLKPVKPSMGVEDVEDVKDKMQTFILFFIPYKE